MAKTTRILVAVSLLCGGTTVKGALKPFEAEPGTELTDEVLAKLGLDKNDVADLLDKGSIAEVDARVAAAPASADDAALSAANKRADDAETKVKGLEEKVEQLEKDLEAATKPATPAQ